MKCFILRAVLCLVPLLGGRLCCKAAFPIAPLQQQPVKDSQPSLRWFETELRQSYPAAGWYKKPVPADKPSPVTRGEVVSAPPR